jgi:uncharacterized protein (TIGR03067 family)
MLALAGTLAVLFLGLAPEDEVKKELALLEGEWKVVALEADGSKVPEGKLKGFTLTIRDTRTVATHVEKGEDGKEKEVRQEGTIKIDPSKTPKTIDFTPKPAEGETAKHQLAVYKLDGDKLTVYSARLGETVRPATLEPKSRSGFTLMTLQRVKR